MSRDDEKQMLLSELTGAEIEAHMLARAMARTLEQIPVAEAAVNNLRTKYARQLTEQVRQACRARAYPQPRTLNSQPQ